MSDRSVPGLAHALAHDALAGRLEHRWRPAVVAALLGTIPAYYLELLREQAGPWATVLYAAAALVLLGALAHAAGACTRPMGHLRRNPFDLMLAGGLLLAAALPASSGSESALVLRSLVALGTLVRMVWALRPVLSRGSLPYLLVTALGLLALCGMGFWWLEPTAHTFEDGLWLAFTTAATVGFGDIVPTTTASRIFSVFVVLLGLGVLTLVTAAIAATLVEGEERRIEHEILRDMHHQLRSLREELAAVRAQLQRNAPEVRAPDDATAAEAAPRR